MFDFDRILMDIEASFAVLDSHKLLELLREMEKEAEVCVSTDPATAFRLLRACILGTQTLRQRIEGSRNLQPRPPLCH